MHTQTPHSRWQPARTRHAGLSPKREFEFHRRGIYIGADGGFLNDRNDVYIVDQQDERPSGPLIAIDYFHGVHPEVGEAVFQYMSWLDDDDMEGEELDLYASQVISSRSWTVKALVKLQRAYRSRRFQRTSRVPRRRGFEKRKAATSSD